MGIRSRIKSTVKQVLFGQDIAQPQSSSDQEIPVPTTNPTPIQQPSPMSDEPESSTATPTSAPPSSPVATSNTEANTDPKVLKHRNRTISALLQMAVDNGGTASLGDLHDLAESRYFIAHKAFSDLMEEMVAKGVFQYDWGAQVATVTEVGQAFLEEHPPRRKG